jgi:hypothetical protein
MSISSTSLGGSSGWNIGVMRQRMQPPDLTKDQFSKMKEKMQSDGKDTTNLDKILTNFDQIDTDQDRKISKIEMESGAEQFGIELPKGPPGPPPPDGQASDAGQGGAFMGGPPPGMSFLDGTNNTSENSNALLQELLKRFSSADPNASVSSLLSSIDTAA